MLALTIDRSARAHRASRSTNRPPRLAELRGVLLREHKWRVREGSCSPSRPERGGTSRPSTRLRRSGPRLASTRGRELGADPKVGGFVWRGRSRSRSAPTFLAVTASESTPSQRPLTSPSTPGRRFLVALLQRRCDYRDSPSDHRSGQDPRARSDRSAVRSERRLPAREETRSRVAETHLPMDRAVAASVRRLRSAGVRSDRLPTFRTTSTGSAGSRTTRSWSSRRRCGAGASRVGCPYPSPKGGDREGSSLPLRRSHRGRDG